MHGFQNNLAQLSFETCSDKVHVCSRGAQHIIGRCRCRKLKVKVTLAGQTIKWSLASVNIINQNFWFININKKKSLQVSFCLMGESVLHMPIDH